MDLGVYVCVRTTATTYRPAFKTFSKFNNSPKHRISLSPQCQQFLSHQGLFKGDKVARSSWLEVIRIYLKSFKISGNFYNFFQSTAKNRPETYKYNIKKALTWPPCLITEYLDGLMLAQDATNRAPQTSIINLFQLGSW